MKGTGRHTQSGASIIEILIVLVVVAILFTMAAAQFGRTGQNFDRQNIAREFKISLERARFDSVKRHASDPVSQSRVVITGATDFNYATDLNQNGVLNDPGEVRDVNFQNRGNTVIVGNALVFPITIKFDQRGQITATDGTNASINPQFYFCDGCASVADVTSQNSTLIYISPTGTVVSLRGGESVPTFTAPTVSDVPVTQQINPLLAVWDLLTGTPAPTPTPSGTPSGTATPTPTPTATPTATPTPTPTATPTPSPSPTASPTASPTPSPTATPIACTRGQVPSANNCVCKSPMTVKSSGKCM